MAINPYFLKDEPMGGSDPDPEPRLATTPAADLPVRCNRCKWEGTMSQLKGIYVPNPSEPGDVIKELGCPACLSDGFLEFKEEDDDKVANLKTPTALEKLPD